MNINKILTTLLGMALCLPLAASSQNSSNDQKEQVAVLRFCEKPAIDYALSFGNGDIAVNICEYLIYPDYARIKRFSRAWLTMMNKALANESNRLGLPEGDNLTFYTNELLDNAPKEDLARISVIKNLTLLALRSRDPGKTFLDAFCKDLTLPAGDLIFDTMRQEFIDTRICVLNNGLLYMHSEVKEFIELGEQIAALEKVLKTHQQELNQGIREAQSQIVEVSRQLAPLKQRQQLVFEHLKPILKAWRPYGIFLKLAHIIEPDEEEDACYLLNAVNHFDRNFMIPTVLNVSTAPQICDLMPTVPMPMPTENLPTVFTSALCYMESQYDLNNAQWNNEVDGILEGAGNEIARIKIGPERLAVEDRVTAAFQQRINYLQERIKYFAEREANSESQLTTSVNRVEKQDATAKLTKVQSNQKIFLAQCQAHRTQLTNANHSNNLLTQAIPDNNAKK